MDFMIGLDFRAPIRIVCLKALPDKRFLVTHCEVIDHLAQCSLDVSQFINIALPDIAVLNKGISETNENNTDRVWDRRGESGVMTSREKRDKILAQFQQHHLNIHAIDIESEAIARALRILCDVTDQYMGILFYDYHKKIYLSIFKDQQKIFFHQENMSDNHQDNIDNIIKRAFKLVEARYDNPIEISQLKVYIIGECPKELSKWGIVPDITQKLNFELESHQDRFKKENTQWLLACGLSLWDKKSSWNLMPWRESDKRKERKILFKQIVKVMLYGLGIVLLTHGLILSALHFQDEHNSVLDEKIQKMNTKALAVNQAEQEINTLRSRIKILKQFSDDQLLSIRFLNNLSQSMPDGVFLNSLTVLHRKASIAGRAETEAQINALLDTLKHRSDLVNVILKNTSQDESNPPYHFDFNIEMELN